jgi:DNA polymerase-1
MKVVLDIETNGLNPDKIWCAVARDALTGDVIDVFYPYRDPAPIRTFADSVTQWIGHNFIWFDGPVLERLAGCKIHSVVDTLVVSRLLDFNRAGGHSLEQYGLEFGVKKKHADIRDWSEFRDDYVERCLSDTDINQRLYAKQLPYIQSARWGPSIETEHFVASELRQTHVNGFHFNVDKAKELCYTIGVELDEIDRNLRSSFDNKVRFVRSIEPRITKHGTLNRSDFRFVRDGDLTAFNGGPFSLIEYEEFNPGSPSQIVERLNEAGWKPTVKTKGHIQALRDKDQEKIAKFAVSGWKVCEENLNTLPATAPEPAHKLARRILLANRLRTIQGEWIDNVQPDGRIHGQINHIGAWTHRCSHDKPNTGNIPRDDAAFGVEMRRCWDVEEGFLVGVDAESIQLRVLAHYINSDAFTHSLIAGKKEDGTDPHSLNKRALGDACKSRNDAKTFIYAWLLGSGIAKVAEILGCSYVEAKKANDDFLTFYPGLRILKSNIIPRDAARGYFEAFDGRFIRIFGDDESSRSHLALAGYLQAGEAIVMKRAMQIWIPAARRLKIPFKLVNFVHDEWQSQVYGSYDAALELANLKADSIRQAGEDLRLRCPMAGAIIGGHGKIAIGQNWYETH